MLFRSETHYYDRFMCVIVLQTAYGIHRVENSIQQVSFMIKQKYSRNRHSLLHKTECSVLYSSIPSMYNMTHSGLIHNNNDNDDLLLSPLTYLSDAHNSFAVTAPPQFSARSLNFRLFISPFILYTTY